NAIPNSSFECGGEGFGSVSTGIPGWGCNVFSLLGQWDSERAFHGRHSWRISLSPDALPVAYFDYFDPIEAPLREILVGHKGWMPVERGKKYVFSAYVLADRPGLKARVVLREADGRATERTFDVGQEWTRVQLSLTAQRDFVSGAAGLDLKGAEKPQGTLWVDALQWEEGQVASPYQPRESVESRVETGQPGNVFTEPDRGLRFRLRAANTAGGPQDVRGTLTITDFTDSAVWRENVEISLRAEQETSREWPRVLAGRRGFFRLAWKPDNGTTQTLRCAVIDPSPERDSAFGMNHAFSWEFLLRLSHSAGVRWWRDWSVMWHTVQPQRDGFDFHIPDPQIDRVVKADGQVLVLLPFSSTRWAAGNEIRKLGEAVNKADYTSRRSVVALKPERLEDFAAYVRAAVRRYRARTQAFEILNEPLYTSYAVPHSAGYQLSDYIDLLRTAYQAAKSVDKECLVVGGIAAPPDSKWVAEFVAKGGLQWCDVMNYHLYPHQGAPDTYEAALRERREAMQRLGQAKPIWVTEIGCYGDDDPPFLPFTVGDDSMNRALRPSELRAAADLVKFATIFCAYGVQKIFYHAGTCSALNQADAGNVFFEFGGAPRKQYAAQAALSRLLGPDLEFVRKWSEPKAIQAFEFRSRGRTVVVVWAQKRGGPSLQVPEGFQALDIMGNKQDVQRVTATDIPVYLVRAD
ncbi:hypothetical protein FJY63_05970, partial [Candidatus Sumerlaeota bacterium]|nr:hypothetical protein [Candidatus Sumerlaeota bacterium]